MSAVNFPLLRVVDDAGAIVSGATVTITSVKDADGADIASHGAVLHTSGSNISVNYDPETKGEAWIVLAISKAATTITGLNAAPAFYLARDSGRIDAAISSRPDAAGVRAALGLAAADLDTQLDAIAAGGGGTDTISIDGDSVEIH